MAVGCEKSVSSGFSERAGHSARMGYKVRFVCVVFFDAQYLECTEAVGRCKDKFCAISAPSKVSPGIYFRALLHARSSFFGLRRAYFSGAGLFNVGTSCGFAAVTGTSCSISTTIFAIFRGLLRLQAFVLRGMIMDCFSRSKRNRHVNISSRQSTALH